MNDEFSLESARDAAEQDAIEEWVFAFLASPGSDNADLGDQLRDEGLEWSGPMRLPLDRLNRLAGPADGPVLVEVDDDGWRDDVYEMKDKVEDGWEPPPIIVVQRGGQLVLEDGNHRVESLRQAGEREAWAFVGCAPGSQGSPGFGDPTAG